MLSSNNNPNKAEENEIQVAAAAEAAEEEEECWDLPSDFNLYAKHEVKRVYFPTTSFSHTATETETDTEQCTTTTSVASLNARYRNSFLIECIEPDTPLDINNKTQSSNLYDATGHCVWAGAFLLIQCIQELHTKVGIEGRRMIEFGCGTGIGGLAMLLFNNNNKENSDEGSMVPAASSVCFTDNDPDALKVCAKNCALNNLPEECYSIQELTWGEDTEHNNKDGSSSLFDIALATDVLYDVDLIKPLFTSVSQCIPSSTGVFILSHIPRACYNEGNPPEAVEDLEQYIIDQAMLYDLHLEFILRPPPEDEKDDDIAAEILEWCPASAFLGGGILVFRRG